MSSTNSFCWRPWRRPCRWRYNNRRQWRIGWDLPKKRLSAIDMLKTALFADIVEIPYLAPGCQKAGGAFKLPLGPHPLAPVTHVFILSQSRHSVLLKKKWPLLSDLCSGFWRSSIPSGGAGGGTRSREAPGADTWLVGSFRYSCSPARQIRLEAILNGL